MLTFKVHTSGIADLQARFAQACSEAEHDLAMEVASDTSPFVPYLNGVLDNSTQVHKNFIIYKQPYAHYLYEGKVRVDPVTHAAGFLTEDGWKSRFGIKKVLTDRNLNIQTSKHAQAQSHWFEASKKQNLDKWTRFAEKAVKNGL